MIHWICLIKKMRNGGIFRLKKPFRDRYPFPPSYKLRRPNLGFSDSGKKNRISAKEKAKPVSKRNKPLLPSAAVLEIRDANIPKDFHIDGVRLWSWNQYLSGNADPGIEIKGKILKSLREKRDSLCCLNNLFSDGGMILSVEKPLKKPLEIQFLFTPFERQKNLPFRVFIFVKKKGESGNSGDILRQAPLRKPGIRFQRIQIKKTLCFFICKRIVLWRKKPTWITFAWIRAVKKMFS